MTPSPLWFIDRSAGEVTLLLMTAVMILGVVRSSVPGAVPYLVEGLHVNLAMLTVTFGGLHVLTAILDPYAGLGPPDALVPFISLYRGTWLGLGVIAAYLYGATLVSSWPARRLRRPVWIWLHRSMYAAWVLALLHSLGTGSDARNQVFLMLNVAAVVAALVVFVAFRVGEGWRRRPVVWTALGAAAVAVVIGVGAWALTGPLEPGWAKSSGTPPSLLHSP